jgi:hypothetical protein
MKRSGNQKEAILNTENAVVDTDVGATTSRWSIAVRKHSVDLRKRINNSMIAYNRSSNW